MSVITLRATFANKICLNNKKKEEEKLYSRSEGVKLW